MSDEAAATISVQTDTGDTGTVDTATVLTDTGDAGAVDTSAANTNSDAVADVAAAQSILDADDPELSADDKAAAQAIVDAAADDAGTEGSDLPPDTYADFNLPEGMQLDEAALTEASTFFKEDGLTQEKAQKYVDLFAKQIQAGSQAQTETFNQLMSDWREQSANDKEFGGDKYEENVKVAQFAISKYGTPELKQLLNDHGVGNHPEMVRFMVRVGRTLGEDVPGNTGTATSQAQDRVSILYPKTNES